MVHLGIDIGGTKVAIRAEFGDGRVDERMFGWPSGDDLAAEVGLLTRYLTRTTADWADRLEGVGVAMPATVDESGRVVAWPNRPHWTGLDLPALLSGLFPGTTARYLDDGELAAMAEAHEAACARLLYIGVGTGIGGGFVADGRSLAGKTGRSCEIGHVIVDRHGAKCVCGRQGCLQALASGPATLARARRRRGMPVRFEDLQAGLAGGQAWAVSSVDEACAALAVAVASLSEVLNPDAVVIGGGFAASTVGFVARVTGYVNDLARPGHPAVPVRAAALKGASSLHGAVRLARRR